MLGFQMMRYGSESAKGLRGDEWDRHMIFAGASDSFIWLHSALVFITWLAILAVLIAIARWFWFKGNRERK